MLVGVGGRGCRACGCVRHEGRSALHALGVSWACLTFHVVGLSMSNTADLSSWKIVGSLKNTPEHILQRQLFLQ